MKTVDLLAIGLVAFALFNKPSPQPTSTTENWYVYNSSEEGLYSKTGEDGWDARNYVMHDPYKHIYSNVSGVVTIPIEAMVKGINEGAIPGFIEDKGTYKNYYYTL